MFVVLPVFLRGLHVCGASSVSERTTVNDCDAAGGSEMTAVNVCDAACVSQKRQHLYEVEQ
jgi:hypothetical protein